MLNTSSRTWLREATTSLLGGAGLRGMTVKELRATLEVHHGSASGALSNLHKSGDIARLAQMRDRNKVYVLGRYVAGRETEAQGRAA